MNSALLRFAPPVDNRRVERRRDKRVRAQIEAVLQRSSGERSEVQLIDVSANGCNVAGTLDGLRPGSFVSVGIGEHPLLGAIVRWVRCGEAGMEFLRAIPTDREEWHAILDTRL